MWRRLRRLISAFAARATSTATEGSFAALRASSAPPAQDDRYTRYSPARMKRTLSLTLALLIAAFIGTSALAQRKQLTLETIYDPTTKVYFSGAVQSGFDWRSEE